MRNPVCLWLTVWRSLLRLRWISGHEYRTARFATPSNVHVLECARCGKCSVAWSFESLEDQK